MKRRTYLNGVSLATKTLAFIAGAIALPQCLHAATASKRPNIVIIMVDDMGFSDIGCYGAETETPHLDALAKNGLRFTQFYNTGRCCPTRAALLTGLYQHQAGIGHMTNNRGAPAYQGYLNDRCVTIAEALKPAGYYTAISGKWHVGSKPDHWPRKRGFDRFYGIPEGGGHHYRSLPGRHLVVDDKPIVIPDGWYTTTAFTDWALKFIDEGVKMDKPVFLYLAFTAPHWPLQAPENVTANFLGRYRNGWQPHRDARFRRQMEMGMFPKGTKMAPIDPQTPDWKKVKDQEEMDLRMAIHAAMVHLIDEGVGRVVAKLNELAELDNTLILFLTDNGASAEGGSTGFVGARGGDPDAKTGTPDSYVSFGVAGANMCDAPFRKYKKYVHEGGIATPLVVHWPKGIPATRNGTFTDEVGHVIDLLPTCLDMADVTYPQKHNNNDVIPVEGISLKPALMGLRIERPEGLYFEHQGNAAVRDGEWKLVKEHGKSWSLYNLAEDRTELNDLSRKHVKKANDLKMKWMAWAERVGVEQWPIGLKSGK